MDQIKQLENSQDYYAMDLIDETLIEHYYSLPDEEILEAIQLAPPNKFRLETEEF